MQSRPCGNISCSCPIQNISWLIWHFWTEGRGSLHSFSSVAGPVICVCSCADHVSVLQCMIVPLAAGASFTEWCWGDATGQLQTHPCIQTGGHDGETRERSGHSKTDDICQTSLSFCTLLTAIHRLWLFQGEDAHARTDIHFELSSLFHSTSFFTSSSTFLFSR